MTQDNSPPPSEASEYKAVMQNAELCGVYRRWHVPLEVVVSRGIQTDVEEQINVCASQMPLCCRFA